jgi:hypothetical protein
MAHALLRTSPRVVEARRVTRSTLEMMTRDRGMARRSWVGIFPRPARKLVSGGREIVQFELTGGEILSTGYDLARKSVFLTLQPHRGVPNYLTEAWKDSLPKRGLSSR